MKQKHQTLTFLLAIFLILPVWAEENTHFEADEIALREALEDSRNSQSFSQSDVIDALDDLVVWLYEQGRYAEALPLAKESLAIAEETLGQKHPNTISDMNDLGLILLAMGDLPGAKPYIERALAIREEVLGTNHPDTAKSLNSLGSLLHDMGDLAGAKLHLERALAIREEVLGAMHLGTAQSVNNLGTLLHDMGDLAGAKLNHERVLAIYEEVLGVMHPYTATGRNNLGLLLSKMGDFAGAKPYYERALAIREAVLGAKHPETAQSLNNLGTLLQDMDDLSGAKPYLERALAIEEEVLGAMHPETASSLNNLGSLLQDMGDLAGAKPYFERSLAIKEEVMGAMHPGTANSLNNLGVLLYYMGDLAGAKPYYERALAIREEVLGPKHPSTAGSLNNMGNLLRSVGDYAGAKSYYERSLAITEEVLGAMHPSTANFLNNLGVLLRSTGDLTGAKANIERALAIAITYSQPLLLNTVERSLSGLLAEQGHMGEAVFYGKQAVNQIQLMRATMTSLDPELQQTFAQSKQGSYTQLADLLIEQGRLPEAQQVLAMLKDEEYFEFIRRDGDEDNRKTSATLTPLETSAANRLQDHGKTLVAIGEALRDLEKIKAPFRTEEQKAQITELRDQIEAADKAFIAALDVVHASFAELEDSDRREELALEQIEQDRRALVASLGDKVALLQYLVLPDKLYVLMTTARTVQAHTIELPEADLNRLVQQLQEGLRNPAGDVISPSQELYEQLITPVAEQLAAMQAETVMVSLDGTLRYVPFGVLHDGEQYLVEKYALSVFTEAASGMVTLAPNSDWYLAGLGVSEAHPGFSGLPSVPAELEGIVQRNEATDIDGVVEGVVLLDDDFTAQSFRGVLPDYPVVHIASHFRFQPGNEENSFLLLGDGTHLNLGEIRTQGYDFSQVELLTLSACETAVASARARGGEIEGFGTLAQQRGARGVLATLWPVADASTGSFMQTMYQLKSNEPELSKAAVVRQAQLAFLTGDINSGSDTNNSRGGFQSSEETEEPSDWTHPYYWAPFILMGNWL